MLAGVRSASGLAPIIIGLSHAIIKPKSFEVLITDRENL